LGTDADARGSAPPRLEVDGIRKAFDEVVALDGVELLPRDGEFITILGPSGCGKTTLLRIVAGFELPDAGEVRMAGRVVSDGRRGVIVPPERRELGMVFQTYAVWPHMTVDQNVSYPLRLRRRPREEVRRRVAEVLELVGLTGLERRLPSQLSGGQQQRVALARALAPEPRLLLLDEPLSNLDAKLRERMRRDLRLIQQEVGITTILVTHDQSEAIELSDRIFVMDEGRVEQVGPPEELYRQPANEFVANFVGTANVLAGTPVNEAWRLKDGTSIQVEPSPPADARQAVIRPEDIELRRGEGPGEILTRMFSGTAATYLVRLGERDLVVLAPSDSQLRRGDRVGVRARGVHYLAEPSGQRAQEQPE
jgi:iron(III) transport system ATP-binding protein